VRHACQEQTREEAFEIDSTQHARKTPESWFPDEEEENTKQKDNKKLRGEGIPILYVLLFPESI
jgi:hypothetical protein